MDLILFDCDGTLVDSQNVIVSTMTTAFERHGLIPPPREAVLGIVGLSLPIAISTLAPDLDAAELSEVVASYKDTYSHLRRDPSMSAPLYPGIRTALEVLAGRPDTLIGIVTGKSRRGLDAILALHGLDAFFSTLQTADDAPSKPDPTMVLQALAETGGTPERTVVVGDTGFDMAMARAAGAAALGVPWGYHDADRLLAAGAQGIVSGHEDLVPWIERLISASRVS